MSGYWTDAGATEDSDLPAADAGTLNYLANLSNPPPDTQPAFGPSADGGGADYNNYDPYGGGSATPDYGYGQDYSGGTTAGYDPGPDQGSYYPPYQAPAPDFSGGVADEWGGNDPGQAAPQFAYSEPPAPDFSGGISPDDWGGNTTADQQPAWGDERGYTPAPAPFSSGVTDEFAGNDPGQARPAPAYSDEFAGNDPGQAQGWTPGYVDNGAYGPSPEDTFYGVAQRKVDPNTGIEYNWDTTARAPSGGVQSYLAGLNPGTALAGLETSPQQAQQTQAELAGIAADPREFYNWEYTQGSQGIIADRWVQQQQQQAILEQQFAAAADRTKQHQQYTQDNLAQQGYSDQYHQAVQDTGLTAPQLQAIRYGGRASADYGDGTQNTDRFAANQKQAGDQFDYLMGLVQRGYGFGQAAKDAGLSNGEMLNIWAGGQATDPAKLAQIRQQWVDAHAGRSDGPQLSYLADPLAQAAQTIPFAGVAGLTLAGGAFGAAVQRADQAVGHVPGMEQVGQGFYSAAAKVLGGDPADGDQIHSPIGAIAQAFGLSAHDVTAISFGLSAMVDQGYLRSLDDFAATGRPSQDILAYAKALGEQHMATQPVISFAAEQWVNAMLGEIVGGGVKGAIKGVRGEPVAAPEVTLPASARATAAAPDPWNLGTPPWKGVESSGVPEVRPTEVPGATTPGLAGRAPEPAVRGGVPGVEPGAAAPRLAEAPPVAERPPAVQAVGARGGPGAPEPALVAEPPLDRLSAPRASETRPPVSSVPDSPIEAPGPSVAPPEVAAAVARVKADIAAGKMTESPPPIVSKYWTNQGLPDGSAVYDQLRTEGLIETRKDGTRLVPKARQAVVAAANKLASTDRPFLESLTRTEEAKLLSVAYDHPKAVANARAAYPDPVLLRARAVQAIADDPARLARLGALDDTLAARIEPAGWKTGATPEVTAPEVTAPKVTAPEVAPRAPEVAPRATEAAPAATVAPTDPAARAQWQADYAGQSKSGTDILATGDKVGESSLTQADLNALSPAERMAALRKLADAPAPEPVGAGSTTLYSGGAPLVRGLAPTALGAAAGAIAPADSPEDRWRHVAAGAFIGTGLGALRYTQPVMKPAFRKFVYGGAEDLPGVGKGMKIWNTADTQRHIVADRVNHGAYGAIDGELNAKGIDLANPKQKRAALVEIARIIKDPTSVKSIGIFDGVEGQQVAKFLQDHQTEFLKDLKGIVASESSADGVAQKLGIIADDAAKSHFRGTGTTPRDPVIAAQQALVQFFAPVWMTFNPRYHVNNAMSNLSAMLAQAVVSPETALTSRAARGLRDVKGAAGSGIRDSPYITADLTGGPRGSGGLIQKAADKLTGGYASKITEGAANKSEKWAKTSVYDRNYAGHYSAAMRFETGAKGLGDGGPATLFSDHFAGEKPKLANLPQALRDKLPDIIDPREVQRVAQAAAAKGQITPAQVGEIVRTARTRLAGAESYATYETSWALRDYRMRSRLDFTLDHVTPLHFWTTNNILSLGRLVVKQPALLPVAAAAVLAWQSKNNTLPDNLKRTVHLGLRAAADKLPARERDALNKGIDDAYGKGAELYLRPWGWLNPAAGGALDVLDNAQKAGLTQAVSRTDQTLDLMKKMGYNVSPLWEGIGLALRRAGVDTPEINSDKYFNPSLFGQYGTFARDLTERAANGHPDNKALALLRDIPYKFNQVAYGDKYSQGEHEGIAKLLAEQERLGAITHDQALSALAGGEKDPLFIRARQQYFDQGSAKGLVSWAGLPVSARNDYQRQRDQVNQQYFADGASKDDKKKVIADNPWITTDWSKKKSPEDILLGQQLDHLYQQAAAEPDKKKRAAIYNQIDNTKAQAVQAATAAGTPVPPSAQPTQAPAGVAGPATQKLLDQFFALPAPASGGDKDENAKRAAAQQVFLAAHPEVRSYLSNREYDKAGDTVDKRAVARQEQLRPLADQFFALINAGKQAQANALIAANPDLPTVWGKPEQTPGEAHLQQGIDGFFALPAPAKGGNVQENNQRAAAQEAYLVAHPEVRQYLNNAQGDKLDAQDKRDNANHQLLEDRQAQYFAARDAGQTGAANRILAGAGDLPNKLWGKNPAEATDIWAQARQAVTDGDVNPSGRSPEEEVKYNAAMKALGDYPTKGTQADKDKWVAAAKKVGWQPAGTGPAEGYAGAAAWGAASAWGGKEPPGRTPEDQATYTAGMAKLGDYPTNGTSAQKQQWIAAATALGWKSATPAGAAATGDRTPAEQAAYAAGMAKLGPYPANGTSAQKQAWITSATALGWKSTTSTGTTSTGTKTGTTTKTTSTYYPPKAAAKPASAAAKPTAKPATSSYYPPKATATAKPASSAAKPASSAPKPASSAPKAPGSPGNPAGYAFSSGLTAQTPAQQAAHPFTSGAAATGASATAPGGAAPTTTKAGKPVLDQAGFQKALATYRVGDMKGFDAAMAQVQQFAKAGGNAEPYIGQVIRAGKQALYVAIKAYQGDDRKGGNAQRGEFIKRLNAIPDTSDGLKDFLALQDELYPKPKAPPQAA